MKRLLLPPLILGFLSTASVNAFWFSGSPDCNSKKYSTEELSKRSKPGVVTVLTDKASGSGFVVRHIKNQTLILTNSHVIQGANKINVEWSDGNSDRAVVVLDGDASNTLNDLALLKIEGKEGKVLLIKNEDANVGADVIAIGAPQGLSFSLTRGVISSLRNEGKIVQTDTAINSGSSGGPLINKSGCVVGVNTLAGRADKGAVNINFAISGQTAQRFIDKYDPDNPPSIHQEIQSVAVNNRVREREYSYNNEGSSEAAQEYIDRLYKLFNVPGKAGESMKLANIALGLHKNSALAYFYRANAKKQLEDYQGSIDDLTISIKLDPNIPGAYYNRGFAKGELEDYTGAISDYTKAIQIKPDFAFAYFNRGLAKDELEDFTGAISDYTKAIQIDPNDQGAYYNRGYAKDELEDFTGAISDYTKAIQIDPDYTNAYAARGIAKESIDDLDGACSDWQKASRLGHQYSKQWVENQCD